jgi:3-phosphoshikimate 1-carboxyvinyltransferase
MAMAFAPAALVLPLGLQVAEPGVVTKSYPAYWEDLKQAGFNIMEIQ